MGIPESTNYRADIRPKRILICFLLVLLTAGCALKVKLVGKYDEVLDESIREIQTQTSSFFIALKKDLGTSEADYGNHESFYDKVKGELSFQVLRAEILEEDAKVNTLTTLLNDLKSQYDDFEMLHEKDKLNEQVLQSSNEAFDRSFRAITVYMVHLKQHNKIED